MAVQEDMWPYELATQKHPRNLRRFPLFFCLMWRTLPLRKNDNLLKVYMPIEHTAHQTLIYRVKGKADSIFQLHLMTGKKYRLQRVRYLNVRNNSCRGNPSVCTFPNFPVGLGPGSVCHMTSFCSVNVLLFSASVSLGNDCWWVSPAESPGTELCRVREDRISVILTSQTI